MLVPTERSRVARTPIRHRPNLSRMMCPLLALFIAGSLSASLAASEFQLKVDDDKGEISVLRKDGNAAVVTQHARPDFRPYLHPITAPDGKGVLTEYSPGHHKHQTGLYWGFTRVNGRDYFHHPADNYWKRKSIKGLSPSGSTVKWQTVYDLLDAAGNAVLTETQTWTMSESEGRFVLDLVWQGHAQTDVTIGRYNYGGLFLRMPWRKGIKGSAVNALGQVNQNAEGQRGVWVDVGIQIDGRDDLGHIAILDHPKNADFPLPWRVDGQLGVGPVRARLGDWKINKGDTATIRHRLLVYTGARSDDALNAAWKSYTGMNEEASARVLDTADRNNIRKSDLHSLVIQSLLSTDDPAVTRSMLRGMVAGLAGRRNVAPPTGWNDLSSKLATSDDSAIRDLARRLAQVFGDPEATAKALAVLKDQAADVAARRIALHSLLNQQNKDVSDLLESLIAEPKLAIDAIRGYAVIENAAAPAILLSRYKQMPTEQRRAAIETLATRKSYATALMKALQSSKIAREDIPVHVSRALAGLLGGQFTKVFGEVPTIGKEREAVIAKFKKMITPSAVAKADASRGRAVYTRSCAVCHVLYGEGGTIGPDLTGSNRANLDYILLNMVDPNFDVPDAYKMVTVTTKDGRVISGIVVEEDATRVTVKAVGNITATITKDSIKSRVVSPLSMMPPGLLQAMKQQEVIDLIKYLRTTKQVEMPQ